MGIARCGRASACVCVCVCGCLRMQVHAFACSVRSLHRLAVAEQQNTALHSRTQEEAAASPSLPPGARAACLSAACLSHYHHGYEQPRAHHPRGGCAHVRKRCVICPPSPSRPSPAPAPCHSASAFPLTALSSERSFFLSLGLLPPPLFHYFAGANFFAFLSKAKRNIWCAMHNTFTLSPHFLHFMLTQSQICDSNII